MFRGRHEYTIDGKGRIAIPAKFRELIAQEYAGQPLVVTNLDQCLVAYPQRVWSQIEQRALQIPASNVAAREFRRHFIAPAEECPLDRQGRILIPHSHREHAALERDVVLLGMLDCFEIWAKIRHQQDKTRVTPNIEQIMADLEKFGI